MTPPRTAKEALDLFHAWTGGTIFDATDLKKVFRELALKHHPDKHPPDKKEEQNKIMQQINDANDVLQKHFKDRETETAAHETGEEGRGSGTHERRQEHKNTNYASSNEPKKNYASSLTDFLLRMASTGVLGKRDVFGTEIELDHLELQWAGTMPGYGQQFLPHMREEVRVQLHEILLTALEAPDLKKLKSRVEDLLVVDVWINQHSAFQSSKKRDGDEEDDGEELGKSPPWLVCLDKRQGADLGLKDGDFVLLMPRSTGFKFPLKDHALKVAVPAVMTSKRYAEVIGEGAFQIEQLAHCPPIDGVCGTVPFTVVRLLSLFLEQLRYGRLRKFGLDKSSDEFVTGIEDAFCGRKYLRNEFDEDNCASKLNEFDEDNSSLNLSQRRALQKTTNLERGCLGIHGPPGTGKTNTLVEVIDKQVLLHRRDDSSLGLLEDKDPGPPQVGVFAPTNRAMQELCCRFVDKKVLNSKVSSRFPQAQARPEIKIHLSSVVMLRSQRLDLEGAVGEETLRLVDLQSRQDRITAWLKAVHHGLPQLTQAFADPVKTLLEYYRSLEAKQQKVDKNELALSEKELNTLKSTLRRLTAGEFFQVFRDHLVVPSCSAIMLQTRLVKQDFSGGPMRVKLLQDCQKLCDAIVESPFFHESNRADCGPDFVLDKVRDEVFRGRKSWDELRSARPDVSTQSTLADASGCCRKICHKYQSGPARILAATDDNELKTALLRQADVVFSTYVLPVFRRYRNSLSVSTAIFDEAGQVTRADLAAVFNSSWKRLILAGDHLQLPAVVKSERVKKANYAVSLLQQMSESGLDPENILLLDTQYRMEPAIAHFPNLEFYRGLLHDAPDVIARENAFRDGGGGVLDVKKFGPLVFHDTTNLPLYPNVEADTFRFDRSSYPKDKNNPVIEMQGLPLPNHERREPVSKSLENQMEAFLITKDLEEFVGKLHLLPRFWSRPDEKKKFKIGVIAPYTAQKPLLEKGLAGLRDANQDAVDITIGTVDSFQGSEADLICLSLVRANKFGNVGHVVNPNRANVAITRAKFACWIYGHKSTLIKLENSVWGSLLLHHRDTYGLTVYDCARNFRTKRCSAEKRTEAENMRAFLTRDKIVSAKRSGASSSGGIDASQLFASGCVGDLLDMTLCSSRWHLKLRQKVKDFISGLKQSKSLVVSLAVAELGKGEQFKRDLEQNAPLLDNMTGEIDYAAWNIERTILRGTKGNQMLIWYVWLDGAVSAGALNEDSYFSQMIIVHNVVLQKDSDKACAELADQLRSGQSREFLKACCQRGRNPSDDGIVTPLTFSAAKVGSARAHRLERFLGVTPPDDFGKWARDRQEDWIRTAIGHGRRARRAGHDPSREITLPKFEKYIWPSIRKQAGDQSLRALSAFQEIMDIKGLIDCSSADDGEVQTRVKTQKEYIEGVTRKNQVFTEQKSREKLYKVFREYEAVRHLEDWDICDLCANLYNRFRSYGYGGRRAEKFLSDESQDLLPCEMLAFTILARDENSFLWAYDMAQTIAEGRKFKVAELKTLLYHRYRGGGAGAGGKNDNQRERSGISLIESPQDLKRKEALSLNLKPRYLTENFRTHDGVLKVSSLLCVDMLKVFFPDQIDCQMPREESRDAGESPCLIYDLEDEAFAAMLFHEHEDASPSASRRRNGTTSRQLGPNQAIIIYSEEQRSDVRRFFHSSEDVPNVFTPQQIKGLQFESVLIWKWFSSAPEHKCWSLLPSGLDALCSGNKAAAEVARGKMSEADLDVWCRELKLLYVNITRPQQKLLFFEGVCKNEKVRNNLDSIRKLLIDAPRSGRLTARGEVPSKDLHDPTCQHDYNPRNNEMKKEDHLILMGRGGGSSSTSTFKNSSTTSASASEKEHLRLNERHLEFVRGFAQLSATVDEFSKKGMEFFEGHRWSDAVAMFHRAGGKQELITLCRAHEEQENASEARGHDPAAFAKHLKQAAAFYKQILIGNAQTLLASKLQAQKKQPSVSRTAEREGEQRSDYVRFSEDEAKRLDLVNDFALPALTCFKDAGLHEEVAVTYSTLLNKPREAAEKFEEAARARGHTKKETSSTTTSEEEQVATLLHLAGLEYVECALLTEQQKYAEEDEEENDEDPELNEGAEAARARKENWAKALSLLWECDAKEVSRTMAGNGKDQTRKAPTTALKLKVLDTLKHHGEKIPRDLKITEKRNTHYRRKPDEEFPGGNKLLAADPPNSGANEPAPDSEQGPQPGESANAASSSSGGKNKKGKAAASKKKQGANKKAQQQEKQGPLAENRKKKLALERELKEVQGDLAKLPSHEALRLQVLSVAERKRVLSDLARILPDPDDAVDFLDFHGALPLAPKFLFPSQANLPTATTTSVCVPSNQFSSYDLTQLYRLARYAAEATGQWTESHRLLGRLADATTTDADARDALIQRQLHHVRCTDKLLPARAGIFSVIPEDAWNLQPFPNTLDEMRRAVRKRPLKPEPGILMATLMREFVSHGKFVLSTRSVGEVLEDIRRTTAVVGVCGSSAGYCFSSLMQTERNKMLSADAAAMHEMEFVAHRCGDLADRVSMRTKGKGKPGKEVEAVFDVESSVGVEAAGTTAPDPEYGDKTDETVTGTGPGKVDECEWSEALQTRDTEDLSRLVDAVGRHAASQQARRIACLSS
eukprot:g6448.t1